jgi:hypothetical protein
MEERSGLNTEFSNRLDLFLENACTAPKCKRHANWFRDARLCSRAPLKRDFMSNLSRLMYASRPQTEPKALGTKF